MIPTGVFPGPSGFAVVILTVFLWNAPVRLLSLPTVAILCGWECIRRRTLQDLKELTSHRKLPLLVDMQKTGLLEEIRVGARG